MKSENVVCIYHGNCADGFGAALVVREALGRGITFIPGTYSDPPPLERLKEKRVVIVDFSFKRGVMTQVADVANTVLLVDHHKSAIADLEGWANERNALRAGSVEQLFDVNYSGAALAWQWFFPMEPLPLLLYHIQQRDLWREESSDWQATRNVSAAIFSHSYDFELWWQWLKNPQAFQELMKEGAAIERKHFKDIRELLPQVTRRMNIGGYNVPVANLPYIFSSDAGNILARGEAFAGCYMDTPTHRVFSLRSSREDEAVDVSLIAQRYGGGGHAKAAGFRIDRNVAKVFEVE